MWETRHPHEYTGQKLEVKLRSKAILFQYFQFFFKITLFLCLADNRLFCKSVKSYG